MQPEGAGMWIGLLAEHPPFQELVAALKGARHAEAGGLWGSAAAFVLGAVTARLDLPAILVTAGEEEAADLFQDLEQLARHDPQCGCAPVLLPEYESLAADEQNVSAETLHGRVLALCRLMVEAPAGGPVPLVVASARAALQGVIAPKAARAAKVALAPGARLAPEGLRRTLAERGYQGVASVEAPGEFAARGGILDVYPWSAARPLRVEFLGEEIESLREFDPATQVSEHAVEFSTLLLLDRADLFAAHGAADRQSSILDYTGPEALIGLLEPNAIAERAEKLAAAGDLPGASGRWKRFVEKAERRLLLRAQHLPSLARRGAVNFRCESGQRFSGDPGDLEDEMRAVRHLGMELTVFCASEPDRDRLERRLADLPLPDGGRWVRLLLGSVARAFAFPDAGFMAANQSDLTARVRLSRPRGDGAAVSTRAIDDFLDLTAGDYVVHMTHGIGRFLRMEQVEREGARQDYLVIEFREERRLYVPAAKVDLVQRYVGAKGLEPRLDRMGGRSWEAKKETVSRAVHDLAAELLEVHALRTREEGFAFPAEDEVQRRFGGSFAYEETPDQAACIEEVRRDMEAKKPMDRLICGDVGFGKTEIAVRACFKAVRAGKQAAVLAPTTILTEQHEKTFRDRMRPFGVLVEALSRFRSPAEQQAILARAATGDVDIVIGTHRLLSGDVRFRDLGLLVIDEEQRFGVEHKERLRRLKKTVDVLTLTATPIPRSLHMSLLGIRDISSLTTPPQDRLAVITEVVRHDPKIIQAGIRRELGRGGQVFFLHNQVRDLPLIARMVQELAPEARVLHLHGQMAAGRIEAGMARFLDREIDVLVTTAIIESGLDIPNANTIFVNRADRFGLADLHQLRGRVGRSGARAYAYFLLPEDTTLSVDAERRLRAIEEHSQLGAGFTIAMKDLEIRGAGNILGAEQSGHIAAVGYEMYCRLLERSVRALKGEPVVSTEKVFVDFVGDAFIPSAYVPDERTRLDVYRRVSRLATPEEGAALLAELRDRFGPPPPEVALLVAVVEVREMLAKVGVTRVVQYEHGLMVNFRRAPELLAFLAPEKARVNLFNPDTLYIILQPHERRPEFIVDLFRRLAGRAERSSAWAAPPCRQ
ncbi:MAG: transcription-repair coupling factor [Planctomycetes bacterium]|nr:transcription-repair coupling factor [Planctomycetota bacterium]